MPASPRSLPLLPQHEEMPPPGSLPDPQVGSYSFMPHFLSPRHSHKETVSKVQCYTPLRTETQRARKTDCSGLTLSPGAGAAQQLTEGRERRREERGAVLRGCA